MLEKQEFLWMEKMESVVGGKPEVLGRKKYC